MTAPANDKAAPIPAERISPADKAALRYPGLYAACLDIALDNGGINRSRSLKDQVSSYAKWLATQPEEVLQPIDAWLSTLGGERLNLVCCGGMDEPETEAAKEGAPPFLEDVLNSYFDEVC